MIQCNLLVRRLTLIVLTVIIGIFLMACEGSGNVQKAKLENESSQNQRLPKRYHLVILMDQSGSFKDLREPSANKVNEIIRTIGENNRLADITRLTLGTIGNEVDINFSDRCSDGKINNAYDEFKKAVKAPNKSQTDLTRAFNYAAEYFERYKEDGAENHNILLVFSDGELSVPHDSSNTPQIDSGLKNANVYLIYPNLEQMKKIDEEAQKSGISIRYVPESEAKTLDIGKEIFNLK